MSIAWDLYIVDAVTPQEDFGGPEVSDDELDARAAARCRVEEIEPVEVPVEYELPDGRVLECVVALEDGVAAWVDAWTSDGERFALDDAQREAIVAMATKGYL